MGHAQGVVKNRSTLPGTIEDDTDEGERARAAFGREAYDRLGQGYTLLRLDPDADTEPLTAAAAAAGLPLEVIDVPAGAAPAEYAHALLICREDQHIAWRGNATPSDPAALVALLRGAQAAGGPCGASGRSE